MKQISEPQLILPSLYLMSLDSKGERTTSQLVKQVTEILHPTGQDAAILNGRSDTHFSQKVRNLKSHNTLTADGYATYDERRYRLTDKGRAFVEANKESINYLLMSGFGYADISQSFEDIYLSPKVKRQPFEEMILEGTAKGLRTETSRTLRSKKLHDAAIDYFSHGGRLVCDCCGFDYHDYYGEKCMHSCIEIHHKKPIFSYHGEDMLKTIEEALANLMPVCPNCHRLIHRHNMGIQEVDDLRSYLSFRP